ncbi:TRAP transporter large permease [Thermodesulfobacteriota bacterium]
MDATILGYIGLALMLILLFSGMPIAIVMGAIGFVGIVILAGWKGGYAVLGTVPFRTWSSYDLSVAPLFILMGSICFHSGSSKDLYRSVHNWLGHLPGGMAMATVGACAGFSAVSGSSIATAATMGTVALPEMKRYKYSPALATGCVAAGGTMGTLIPPSVPLIIYAMLTQQSIGKLFLAGFLPGVLEAAFYIATIYILCRLNPIIGPRGPLTSFKTKIYSLRDTWPFIVLFVLVIGGIYIGLFSPIEAAGIGSFFAFLFAILRRKLTLQAFWTALSATGQTTAMIFILLTGALIFGYFLTLSRLPFDLADFIGGLPLNRHVIMIFIVITYIFLGCAIDAMAMILLTVPIFYPVVETLGFDPIWFGIIIVRVMEMGMITPPVGMNVYVIKSVAKDVPIGTIFRGIVPFVIADVFHVALLMAFPQISLFLPNLMKN